MGSACGRDCLIGPAGVPNKNSVSSDISGMSPEYWLGMAWHTSRRIGLPCRSAIFTDALTDSRNILWSRCVDDRWSTFWEELDFELKSWVVVHETEMSPTTENSRITINATDSSRLKQRALLLVM